MEPLSPNDPLWKLLGQSRPVEPRSNFLQNVMREARQTPQERGWLARVRGWWQDSTQGAPAGLAWAGVAALAVAAALVLYNPAPETSSPAMASTNGPAPAAAQADLVLGDAEFPLVPEFETQWKEMEQMGALLAVQDTSALTDTEIHLLLY